MSAVITCPLWCEDKHTNESSHPDDRPVHYKYFGDPAGANISFWMAYNSDGSREDSGICWNIEESSDPEDMDEVAGWCIAAAAFMREIRGAVVTP